MATRHGAWGGAAAGAVVGILFPPAIIGSAIVGESKLQQAVEKAELKAEKHVAKELDVSKKDVDQAVQEAATEVS
jgi:hypothetical protein